MPTIKNLKENNDAEKSIPYAAEIMKDFICSYIDSKAKMQFDVVNKTIEKTKSMAQTHKEASR